MRKFLQIKIAAVMVAIFITSCTGGNDAPPPNALTATPNRASWIQTAVNQLAGKKDIIITNTTNTDITGINYYLEKKQSAIFLVGSDCTESLPANATCKVSVDFLPDQKGRAYSDKYVFEYDSKSGKSVSSILLSGNTLQATGEESGINGLLIINAKKVGNAWEYKETISSPVGISSNEIFVAFRWIGSSSALVRVVENETNGEFILRNGCTAHLTMNDVCNVYFTFTPATETPITSSYTIRALKDDGSVAQEITLNIKAKGEEPSKSDDITMTSDGENFTSATPVGQISSDEKTVTIKNNTDKTIYYRVVSTSGSFNVNLNSCTGVMRASGTEGDSCKVKVKHSPSKVGTEQAYIRVVAGSKASFIKFTGTGAPSETSTNSVQISSNVLAFPDTEEGFLSSPKRITFKATQSNNTTIAFKLSDDKYIQIFRYTTTCMPSTPLAENESCYIDMSYAPFNDTSVGINPNATNISVIATINNDDQKELHYIAVLGNMLPKKVADLETPIPNVTVSTKRYNFPDTAVGLASTALLVKVTNNGTEDVRGFRSTSTDLVNFPLVKDLTTCGAVIAAGKDCNIAYQFVARSTTPRTAYLSIWADGVEGDNQIIQVSGRGSLFNKYLSFGFVDPSAGAQKILSMAYVNDTTVLQKISSVELSAFKTDWDWSTSRDSFVANAFTNTPLTAGQNPFSIVSNDCANRELVTQQSCIIRVQFDTAKTPDNITDNSSYRAYIRLKDSDNKTLTFKDSNSNQEYIVGQFHATASTRPDTIMYFPADNSDPANPYQPSAYVDSMFPSLGEKIFYMGGIPAYRAATGDENSLKVYDASRNMWKKLKPSGNSPFTAHGDYKILSTSPSAIVNSKLYLFSGTIYKNAEMTTKINMNDLFVYDPNDTKISPDGSWQKLSYTAATAPAARHASSAAALKGYMFTFGGWSDFYSNVLPDFLAIDLRDETKITIQDLAEKTSTADRPYPGARSNAAITVFNDKIYIHGGNINVNGGFPQVNDLWEYTPEFDADGNIQTTGKWKRLYAGDSSTDNPTAQLRPESREKHKLVPVADKLYLTGSGFQWPDQAISPNRKIYFEILPENYDETNDKRTAVFKPFKTSDPNDFTKLGREIAGKVAGHNTTSVEGVFWFHNVNIMGLYMEAK